MIRELFELLDWMGYHVDGRIMLADLGTKPLPADRFGFLVDRLRVLRKRFSCATKTAAPLQIKRLITLFCLTSLVERADGAEIAEGAGRDSLDYMFFGVCMAAGSE